VPVVKKVSTTIELHGSVTVGELEDAIKLLNRAHKVDITSYPGDQRDPSYTVIRVYE
jgi:hypothetical protein